MRRLTPLAFALLLAPLAASAAEPMSADQCFLPAFKAGDADAVTACYAPDAVLWIPGGPMAQGTQAIHDGFAGFFADYAIKDMTITPMGSRMVGEDKATWGTFTLVHVNKATGEETTEIGRYTDLSRLVDGKWLYVVDHASDDPLPAGGD
jgi:uncharacterized protein (TIGR02246 family)